MERVRKFELAFVAVLIAVGLLAAVAAWHRGAYHEWPGVSFPDRLDHCDRSYAPGDRVSAREAPKPLKFDFRFDPELAAHHDVYLEPDKLFTNAPGQRCPMAYFMRDGSSYVAYVLVGGP